jgi:hypothetical protein
MSFYAVPLSSMCCYYLVGEAKGQGKNLLPFMPDYYTIFWEPICSQFFILHIDYYRVILFNFLLLISQNLRAEIQQQ